LAFSEIPNAEGRGIHLATTFRRMKLVYLFQKMVDGDMDPSAFSLGTSEKS
jgi:hypothetical protein